MIGKCKNCGFEGTPTNTDPVIGKKGENQFFCPDCGDNLTITQNHNLDLNKDGKVDKKDAKIASKVMNTVKKKKKPKVTKKKKVTKK